MKKTILIFIAILSITSSTNAQQIVFADGKWKDIVSLAAKDNKLIFVDIYATWCAPCKAMAKNVFTQPAVGQYFNSNFINYKIDAEKGEGPSLTEKYHVTSYPTYLFINGSGELVYKIEGYYQATEFLDKAKKAFLSK